MEYIRFISNLKLKSGLIGMNFTIGHRLIKIDVIWYNKLLTV